MDGMSMRRRSGPTTRLDRWATVILLAVAVMSSRRAAGSLRGSDGTGQAELQQAAAVVIGPQSAGQESFDQAQKRALEEGEAGQTEPAIADYKRALALHADWREGWWNLGSLEYGAGHFEDARSALRRVVGFAPELGLAWGLLGLSEFEMGKLVDARADLEKAKSLGMDQDAEVRRVALYHLGLLWIQAGEFDQARDLLVSEFAGAGDGAAAPIPEQAREAIGLATLRVPLLPTAIDASREALLVAVGEAVVAGKGGLERWAELLKANPQLPYLHLAYGQALSAAGRGEEAKAAWRAEAEISPRSPLPWIALSEAMLTKPGEAVAAARKAVSAAPENGKAHQAVARAQEAAGKSLQAAGERRLAAEKKPDPPEQRLIAYYAAPSPRERADAAAGSPESLKADAAEGSSGSTGAAAGVADDAQAGWAAAMRAYQQADYASAAARLKQWVRIHPESGTGWAILGLSEYQLGDYDNARIHLDRGAQLGLNGSSQSLAQAKFTLGALLVREGEFDRGSELLAESVAGRPAEEAKYGLGLALLHRRELPPTDRSQFDATVREAGDIAGQLRESRYDQAFPRLQKLIANHPKTAYLHYAYGSALEALSEFDQAAQQMKLEMLLSPRSETPLCGLASIALRQHDAVAAKNWAQEALRRAPNSIDAHYLLGRAALESGDGGTAVRELETASRLSPGSPEVHFNLARAYEHTGQPQRASEEREVFQRLHAAAERK